MVAVILYYPHHSHHSLSHIDTTPVEIVNHVEPMPSRDTQVGDTSMHAFFGLWYVCYHYLYRNQVRALCNPTHKEASVMVWAFAFQKKGIDASDACRTGAM